jgi:soluble cytochrome b562
MPKKKKHKYKPTATLKGYKEAIQILMVDYADVWEKTGTFKEVDKKLKKLGI